MKLYSGRELILMEKTLLRIVFSQMLIITVAVVTMNLTLTTPPVMVVALQLGEKTHPK
jgi:hypothetical protein